MDRGQIAQENSKNPVLKAREGAWGGHILKKVNMRLRYVEKAK